MIQYNQYYTSKHISDLVTGLIKIRSPQTCLELSAGEGALLESVKKKFPAIHCTTFDIDPKNVNVLRTKFPTDLHFCADATGKQCQSILTSKEFDIAVCNPPFSMAMVDDVAHNYLKINFGNIYLKNKKIRSEILFLAINLTYIRNGGTLAIIVPELIIKGCSFEKLRSTLSESLSLKYLIECDCKSFSKTEAKTYVIILEKKAPTKNSKYHYIKINRSIEIVHEEKMDLSTFVQKRKNKQAKSNSYKIIRGKLSGKECKSSGKKYLHTTNMAADLEQITLEENIFNSDEKTIIAGDIIIARVGSRVIGKTNIIASGSAIISDCLLSVRFKYEKDKRKFLDHWAKNKHEWIFTHAAGTCAKHITMTNLSSYIDSIL
ncbi:N-6 DNA methylase [Citrobacter portucalensis]|uniref:N-6 DNA methylase n=1 Tax=Citrobacter portucalensis TaxID=1639133 RepID=UPI0039F59065